jgi:hypothetical protein
VTPMYPVLARACPQPVGEIMVTAMCPTTTCAAARKRRPVRAGRSGRTINFAHLAAKSMHSLRRRLKNYSVKIHVSIFNDFCVRVINLDLNRIYIDFQFNYDTILA